MALGHHLQEPDGVHDEGSLRCSDCRSVGSEGARARFKLMRLWIFFISVACEA